MGYRQRPDTDEYDTFYAGYVARVPAGDLVTILEKQLADTCALFDRVPPEREDHAYAPGKWSIKEVVGHLADAERVLSYRALRIGRADATELAGYEEDAYVSAASFGRRSLDDLVRELRAVRRASVALFDGFGPEAWTRRGIANGSPVSVRALACIIAGHELHHRAILEERYLAGGG